MSKPATVNLWELTDLCTPWCIFTVVTLRIAEHIAAGITRIEHLADTARCDAQVLHRVMEHLVGKGLFEQPEPGVFALNEPARGLTDPSMRLGLDLEGIGGRMAYAWGTLPKYVRTGIPAYHEVFGMPFWEDLAAHPEISASFDALIGPPGHGTPDPDFPLAGGWDRIRSVIDVGGGTGAMLAEILRARPQVRGTLLDLPSTVERAKETFRQAGVSDRVTTAGQSFFDPLPAGGDVYLLRGVLNDWPDRDATAILKRCAEAARPSGRVVVMKGISGDGAPRGLTIEMVLVGGRHRSVTEFSELALASGLEVISVERAASGPLVVECRPLPTA